MQSMKYSKNTIMPYVNNAVKKEDDSMPKKYSFLWVYTRFGNDGAAPVQYPKIIKHEPVELNVNEMYNDEDEDEYGVWRY